MADKVRINGNVYDFSSTILKIAGEPIYGYTKVDWKATRTRPRVYGQGKGRTAQGKASGKPEFENLKITVRRDTASEIKDMLANLAPNGETYSDPVVPITLQYVEDETNQLPLTMEFIDCNYETDANTTEMEGEADMVEVEFNYIKLDEYINGKRRRIYSGDE